MLIQDEICMDGIKTVSKVENSIDLLRTFEPSALALHQDGYYLCYSGGKDSDTILRIVLESGVKFSAHYNVTGIDPPECIRHIKQVRETLSRKGINLYMDPPDIFTTGIYQGLPKNMWRLIVHNGIPPMRQRRYCCDHLKERGGKGRLCLTGVRWAESAQRKSRKSLEIVTQKKENKKLFSDNDTGRRQFEICMQKGKRVINPIIDWEESDVWDYLKSENCSYCKSYDDGAKRIGCIGCPQGGGEKQKREFEQYPHIRKLYIRAFDEMIRWRKIKGLGVNAAWEDGEHVMEWWTSATVKEQDNICDGQVEMEAEYEA